MKCECGKRGYVVQTRPSKRGDVVRRYKCACGEKFTTIEVRAAGDAPKGMIQRIITKLRHAAKAVVGPA